ncbi:hypothetical protein BDZ97DRAFT_1822588 [Flammula alnicola]|nr:hypothetical protein BDZ97DRAFT_1822588 [Flammula alnicola]
MPEIKEGLGDGFHINHFIDNTRPEQRELKDFWVDSTAAESVTAPPGSLASQGHVHPLPPTSPYIRGQNGSQTKIYPPDFAGNSHISSHHFRLAKVEPSPRNVFLCFEYPVDTSAEPVECAPVNENDDIQSDFKLQDNSDNCSDTSDCSDSGDANNANSNPADSDSNEPKRKVNEYWLQIQLLKHTSVQIFSRDDWENAICKVNRTDRGFKVGLAFEFRDHVLAFLTLDLLIQFHWSSKRSDLPSQQANIYTEYRRFLRQLVEWMQSRRDRPRAQRTGLAITIIRNTSEIFHGGGLYTMEEVFHKAGLSINITERELFDSPSRTARLVSAFMDFTIQAYEEIWDFMNPFLRDFLLTCTREERSLYSDTLMVYGKDRVNCTPRFKQLLSNYQACLEDQGDEKTWERCFGEVGTPYDVFEPDYIKRALTRHDVILGPLIFGHDLWQKLSLCLGPKITSKPFKANVLTKYFSQPGFETSPSSLDLSFYDILFNAPRAQRGMSSWAHTLLYRSKSAGYLNVDSKSSLEHIDGPPRTALLLANVTQHSEIYTVGPLDFCGVAERLNGSGGSEVIMACKLDPRQPVFYQKMQLVGAETAKLRGKGLNKVGLSNSQNNNVMKKLSKYDPQPKRKQEEDDGNKENPSTEPTEAKRPYKKRRRSADRDLMTGI